jgi:hypothetical protein
MEITPRPDLDALEEAANAATQGPWIIERDLDFGNLFITEQFNAKGRVARLWNDRTCTEENAKFIAATNPSAILELIAYVKRLERR